MLTPLLLSGILLLGGPGGAPAAPVTSPMPTVGHTVAPTDSIMGPGVSLALAIRRAATLTDVRYDIALDVTARDSAVGRVRVDFGRRGDGDVVLDFRGRSLGELSVNGRVLASGDYEYNGAHVRLPARLLRPGQNTVTAAFVSAIAPAGASVIRYHDSTDDSDYLYTLLVPADANMLFPCFDQPDLKARVTLTLTTPLQWMAVANGAVIDVDSTAGSRTFRFARTEPLSTYLVAFAAGPWATVTDTVSGRPLTMYVRRSRAAEAEADSLLHLNGKALAWMEEYFGIPYPFGKYDFVLAPAFPFGGMEHPGAVFYNEDRFVFRERPTRSQRTGRASTIYHEVAHQWFGDLVTMRWFDDLWLKEGFATYMAARAQADMEPDSDAWKTFYLRNKPAAYGVDVTAGTTPVWQELGNLDQAKSNYGAIVYNKAPSILKQLDYLVGPDQFQAGVRRFLAAHSYANATWQDLLRAIADGGGLDSWGEQFILRPGMPVVEQTLELDGDRISRLTLTQRPARELSGDAAWPMKLELLLSFEDGTSRRLPIELTGHTTIIDAAAGLPAPDFVFANASDYGYAQVLLDDRSTRWLETNIGRVQDDFLRAMLWGALWDGVREARIPPSRYLAAASRALPDESDDLIAAGLVSRMSRTVTAYLPDDAAAAARPALETLLWAGASDTSRSYDLRKTQLDAYVDIAATDQALARIAEALDGDSIASLALRPPTRWAIVTRLAETDAPGAAARLARESARDTTSDGQRRAFVAGAAWAQPDVKADYFSRYLRDSTLNEDWATSSLGAFNTLAQQQLTLPYLEPALDALPWVQENRRIFFLGSWIGGFMGGQSSAAALVTVERWLAKHPDLAADLRSKVLQAMDELERTVRIRDTAMRAARAGGGAAAR